jgi:flagellar hook-associated protein 2
VVASGGSGAATGRYAVSVSKLAGNQTVVSGSAYPDASTLVGSGSLALDLGAWQEGPPMTFVPTVGGGSTVIDITAADTLSTLRDKINSAAAGVTASLVTDGNGVRLALRSTDSGASNGFRLSATDSDGNATDAAGLSRFAYDPEAGTAAMQLKQAAQDAQATVNGIAVVSPTNELSGVVEGLTLSLRKETTTAVDVTVTPNSDAVKTAVQAFVSAYNDLAKTITDQTKYDATTKVGGPLQGDSAVGSLQRQLRAVLNTPSGASSTFPRLSDIGLELQRDGTLTVNSTKLDTALSNLPELKKAFANNDTGNAANKGFARRYAELSSQILGVDGSLTTRTEGLRARLTRNGTDQQALSDRISRYQARLVAQYTVMDANLSKLSSLSTYLTQQLASITGTTTTTK